jgi:hypothetical protein
MRLKTGQSQRKKNNKIPIKPTGTFLGCWHWHNLVLELASLQFSSSG